MQIQARKTTLVEVIIPATMANGGQVNFLDQPLLRTDNDQQVVIDAIEAYTEDSLALSPLSNTAIADTAAILNAVLTINVGSFDDFKFIPLASLIRVQTTTAGVPFVNELFLTKELTRVNWTKSYIQLQAAPTAPPFAYVFMVYYRVFEPNNKL